MRHPPSGPNPGTRQGRIFYGWYLVGASILVNVVTTAFYFHGFQAFLLPIQETFGVNRTAIVGIFALRQLESGIVGPFVGFMVDRFGARRLIFLGGLFAAANVVAVSQVQTIWQLYLFFAMISVGSSFVTHGITWPIIFSRWFHRRRGLATGLGATGPIIGGTFVILNAALIEASGWRMVAFGYGVILAGVTIFTAAIVRENPEPLGLLPDGDRQDENESEDARARRARSRRASQVGMSPGQAVRTSAFWLLTAYLGILFLASSAFQNQQLAYFVDDKGFSDQAAAVTVALVVLISGVGRTGAGGLMDVMDYRIVMAATTLMMAGSMVYLAVAPIDDLLHAMPFIVLFGLAFGNSIPFRPVVGGLMFGYRRMGSIIGLLQGGTFLSGVVGPLIMGGVFDLTGSYEIALWILAALTMLSLPLLISMKPRQRLIGYQATQGTALVDGAD